MAEGERSYAALAQNLGLVASETRLALLHLLRTPRSIGEIRVGPSLSRLGERPDRNLSRQAVTHQLEQLLEAGLVLRTADPSGAKGDLYVLNHERLFALVDEMRGLAKLRPFVATAPGETVAAEGAARKRAGAGPRLVVAYGRDDGETFPLDGTGVTWRIGRAPECEIRLDYDPFLSGRHAELRRLPAGLVLVDLGSRNGTWVNGERLRGDQAWPLDPGDLLTIGHSQVVFQGPRA